MSLILCLAHKQYRITILEHNKKIFVKLERQLTSNWSLIGERHLPWVRRTDLCVAASREYVLIYDGTIDILFILDTKLNIINCLKSVLSLDLTETSPVRYRSFFLLTEGNLLVLLYEQFHKKHNMTHRCIVKGEMSCHSTLNSAESGTAVPSINLQTYIETEIYNYERTRGAILCNSTIYALVQEPLEPKYTVIVCSISKLNSVPDWEIILHNVNFLQFFVYKHQLFALEFDSHNSLIYHFLPGRPHRIQYVHTEVPLQTERRASNIYAKRGLVYTDSNRILLRLSKFILV